MKAEGSILCGDEGENPEKSYINKGFVSFVQEMRMDIVKKTNVFFVKYLHKYFFYGIMNIPSQKCTHERK